MSTASYEKFKFIEEPAHWIFGGTFFHDWIDDFVIEFCNAKLGYITLDLYKKRYYDSLEEFNPMDPQACTNLIYAKKKEEEKFMIERATAQQLRNLFWNEPCLRYFEKKRIVDTREFWIENPHTIAEAMLNYNSDMARHFHKALELNQIFGDELCPFAWNRVPIIRTKLFIELINLINDRETLERFLQKINDNESFEKSLVMKRIDENAVLPAL